MSSAVWPLCHNVACSSIREMRIKWKWHAWGRLSRQNSLLDWGKKEKRRRVWKTKDDELSSSKNWCMEKFDLRCLYLNKWFATHVVYICFYPWSSMGAPSRLLFPCLTSFQPLCAQECPRTLFFPLSSSVVRVEGHFRVSSLQKWEELSS